MSSPQLNESLEEIIKRGEERLRAQGYPEWHIKKWADNYRHQVSQ